MQTDLVSGDLGQPVRAALCRSALVGLVVGGGDRPRRSRQRAGTTRGWQQGQRWWQGDAPEWNIVSSSIDGRSTLAGEVKWSESPTDRADLDRIAAALLARPWPPSLAKPTHYALFVPRVATAAETTFDAVSVVDAAAVMRALR